MLIVLFLRLLCTVSSYLQINFLEQWCQFYVIPFQSHYLIISSACGSVLAHSRKHLTRFIKMSDISFCPKTKILAWQVGLWEVSPRLKISRLKAQEQLASRILCNYSYFRDVARYSYSITISDQIASLRVRQVATCNKVRIMEY